MLGMGEHCSIRSAMTLLCQIVDSLGLLCWMVGLLCGMAGVEIQCCGAVLCSGVSCDHDNFSNTISSGGAYLC